MRIAVLVVGACATGECLAQVERTPTSILRHLDVDGGLPNARVFTLAHTPDGYVWLGTYGGLARFDGLTFTTFTNEDLPSLGGGGIMALAVDDRGTLWIGTEEGRLVARDARGFRPVEVPVRPGRRINAIRADGAQRLWLGTQDGVWVMDVATSSCTAVAAGLDAADVTHLVVDPAGAPWALAGGVPHRWQRDRWQAIPIDAAEEM
ncbi:MAG: two-component regulator propeller domain-containing protein, partial [Planctomycetia bacterium]